MTERVQVISITGSTLVVRCDATESCSACSTLFCSPRARTYKAQADDDLIAGQRILPEDWVEVEVPESGVVGKGLLLFGLPLILFVVIYIALGGTQSEVVQAGGGFVGLIAGFAGAVGLSKLWQDPLPRVIQVYRSPVLKPAKLPVTSG